MNKEIMITQQDLIDWLDRPPSNDDIDLINFIVCRLDSFYKLKGENERLNNVINGLEKDLEKVFSKMEEKQVEINGRGYYYTDLIPVEDVLDKLKALKGGEKDEI